MEELVAESHFVGINTNNQEVDIVASVGKPFLNPEGVWTCEAKLTGIYGCPDKFYGVDGMQALCLATSFLYKMLFSFVQSGGKIKEAENQEEEYLKAIFGKVS